MNDIYEVVSRIDFDIPFIQCSVNDSIMSSVDIFGSFDGPDKWPNGLRQNSRCFSVQISPKHTRYYRNGDPIEIRMIQCSHLITQKSRKMRSFTTKDIDRVAKKIKDWVENVKMQVLCN